MTYFYRTLQTKTQAKILFDLREKFFEKLFHKGIMKNNPNQSDIKYEENIAEL